MEDESVPIEHSCLVSVDKIGPVQYRCTGPTFCPYRLISCLQLAHNTPSCRTLPSSMVKLIGTFHPEIQITCFFTYLLAVDLVNLRYFTI